MKNLLLFVVRILPIILRGSGFAKKRLKNKLLILPLLLPVAIQVPVNPPQFNHKLIFQICI